MLQRLSRIVAPYAATLAALALITAAAAVLLPHSVPRFLFSTAFLLAILASAWWGGYGPGIFATIVTLAGVPFALTPGFTAARINSAQLLLVPIVSILVSRVGKGRNEREAMLRELNEQLDERVRLRTRELETANAALQEREALLLRQADELARSNTDLQQFAYIASHDLQEPLRLIGIYSELLKRRYGSRIDAEADTFLGVIVDGVRRMETLVRDLLSYSHVIHGADKDEAEEVAVRDAVEDATANLAALIRETGATIHCESLPVLVCDRLEITQVLQNLLSNALKYRGDAPPRIEIGSGMNAGESLIWVRDNGIGIKPDYHETIFHPFKRLHGREYPGTGIGLALCRRIVERAGGRIWLESEAGSGTTFFFTLPVKSVRSKSAQGPDSLTLAARAPGPSASPATPEESRRPWRQQS
ncbi:MAG: DUF4118 domain-containing protein [Acidobacteriia bacterium]|nr:DUF4118 domain-containing protein [Terriglobia bacterium]